MHFLLRPPRGPLPLRPRAGPPLEPCPKLLQEMGARGGDLTGGTEGDGGAQCAKGCFRNRVLQIANRVLKIANRVLKIANRVLKIANRS
jgi:hypothetical protein